jgi:cbb3-type cytochrome oxidase maturation protein
MNVLFVLVPLALCLATAAALAFRWAVKNGQFDDLESPAIRMLIDDQESVKTTDEDE